MTDTRCPTILDLINAVRQVEMTPDDRHAAVVRLGHALKITGPVLEGKNTWRHVETNDGAGAVECDCERPTDEFSRIEDAGFYDYDDSRIPPEDVLARLYCTPLARLIPSPPRNDDHPTPGAMK